MRKLLGFVCLFATHNWPNEPITVNAPSGSYDLWVCQRCGKRDVWTNEGLEGGEHGC